MSKIWDFDETINYITINIDSIPYKVLNKKNNKQISYQNSYNAALLLHSIRQQINLISIYLRLNINNYTKNIQKCINCFLSIHPYNYLLSEMQDEKLLNIPFIGLNKPRNVKNKLLMEPIGRDKNLRAEYRDIFLNIRNYDNSLKRLQSLMSLVIHEITHTACNHVTWKDDNHNNDFKSCEKIIKDAYNNMKKKYNNVYNKSWT